MVIEPAPHPRPNLRICLNLIVKNESTIIEGCLDRLLPFIDYYVICDTGSTDDTTKRIRDFSSRHGLDGEIHHLPFVNFETTRNQALNLCRSSAAEFDYILLVDADMELFVENLGFRDQLTEPAYSIRQTDTISYYNTRLIRRDCSAKYIGVTHEYLDTDAPAVRLAGLWFYDRACGSNRTNKSKRDIKLLKAALQNEPDNGRTMFYLAQSLKDSGRYREAISWYRKRIAIGGWDEEVWYSSYSIALCHEKLGNEEEFIECSLKAYNLRPHRAEPLYRLAKHYRMKGSNEAVMMFCEAAERLPYPAGDSLFIEDHVYSSGIKEEMSISGFYCSSEERKQKGYTACVHLTTDRQAVESTRSTAVRNFFFYAKDAGKLFKDYSVKQIVPSIDLRWPATNPSIWIDERGKYCILRSVNYHILGNGMYHILDSDNVVRTQNHVLVMDDNCEVVECRIMSDLSSGPPKCRSPVEGFEDCRLFSCRGLFWCVCTVRDRHSSARCEIAILSLDSDWNVTQVNVVRSFGADLHQKNWLPLVRNDDLYLIYSTDPTIVLKYDFDNQAANVFKHIVPELCLESLRGGSQAVRVKGGWIYITHEAQQIDAGRRFYMHRFVLMTEDFRVTGVTEPFYFLQKGIEFCAGLAYDNKSGRLIASFGLKDNEAYLAFFDADSVISRASNSAAC